jgi:hypothetical protein
MNCSRPPSKGYSFSKETEKLPKQTLSSSSEDDNGEDKNEENDDVDDGNNQIKVGQVNDQNNYIAYV